MKKGLLILNLLLAFSLASFSQLPDGSIAPDFTLQDIDGNSHHLYDYLDSGKVVILDFFEVMCGPCWQYHEKHCLAQAYDTWGPLGTNELMVFEIEGIKSSAAQIRGETPPTIGNWTEGEPFPFIATCDPNTDQVVKDYQVMFFPSVYMICRDRRVKLIGPADTALIHARMKQCPASPSDSLHMALMSVDSVKSISCGQSIHPYLRLQNYGLKPLFSAKIVASLDQEPPDTLTWSGYLATYEVLNLDGQLFDQLPDGSHTLTYVITELNGYTQGFTEDTIRIRKTLIQSWQELPFTENFEAEQFPYDRWTLDNQYPTIPAWERADLGYAKALRIPYFDINPDYKSRLYLPGISLNSVIQSSLRFDMACTHNNSVNRHAGYDMIQISYSLDCGKNLYNIANLSEIDYQSAPDDSTFFIPSESQWKPIDINLSSLAGNENVVICLLSNPANGNNMYLKNIRIENTTGAPEHPAEQKVILYPQPASETLFVRFSGLQQEVIIEMYDHSGRRIRNLEFYGISEIKLPVREYASGSYMLRIISPDETSIHRIIIN